MDISDFDTVTQADEGAILQLRSPKTGEVMRHDDERAFTIKYIGSDSKKIIDLARKQQDDRAKIVRNGGTITAAAIEADMLELLVAATLEWDIILGGNAPKSEPKEYRAAYKKFPWLYEQGNSFVNLRANFIKA
jgi:hypothetical protein